MRRHGTAPKGITPETRVFHLPHCLSPPFLPSRPPTVANGRPGPFPAARGRLTLSMVSPRCDVTSPRAAERRAGGAPP